MTDEKIYWLIIDYIEQNYDEPNFYANNRKFYQQAYQYYAGGLIKTIIKSPSEIKEGTFLFQLNSSLHLLYKEYTEYALRDKWENYIFSIICDVIADVEGYVASLMHPVEDGQ